jgi:hypothetical protein
MQYYLIIINFQINGVKGRYFGVKGIKEVLDKVILKKQILILEKCFKPLKH